MAIAKSKWNPFGASGSGAQSSAANGREDKAEKVNDPDAKQFGLENVSVEYYCD